MHELASYALSLKSGTDMQSVNKIVDAMDLACNFTVDLGD
ncbi:hypothetical protein KL86APRO_10210 [uncultured Alphaproteobacteria bacterium]|uniref:Uncharacterized protein n=1 Tax=uncultured Alphaproteobacteria bacterium TaxID=91750 RepID=A0A212IY67_9PROT|nr:hypothetical protein KL86APRO_10210 [uncultured Alphaproteobacteria bacterium]